MRSMLCLSALVLVLPMSGCGRTDVGDLAGDQRSTGCGSVTLLAASAFHAKMEVLCSQKGLDLLHVGPLGQTGGGGVINVPASHNQWRILTGQAAIAETARPEKSVLRRLHAGRAGWGVSPERHLVHLELGHFPSDKRAIPVEIGDNKFDVRIMWIRGNRDPDEHWDLLGMSVSEFVRLVAAPTVWGRDAEPAFGRRTRTDTTIP